MHERDSQPARPAGSQTANGLRRRFYKNVTVSPKLGICLDGRPVRTPLKSELLLPSADLAQAIAAEWRAQSDVINPHSMPLTRLANTAIDRTAGLDEAIREDIMAYAANDLVCYRAEFPPDLVARQAELWDPVLSWAKQQTGATWQITSGLQHVEQPQSALAAFARLLPDGAFKLVGCHALTTLTGSALLAVMVEKRLMAVEAAWQASIAEQQWQAEHWGWDAEAEARNASHKAEFLAAAQFINLVAGNSPELP